MPAQCVECPGGFMGCGPDDIDPCSDWGDPDERRCHKVVVLVKELPNGKCTARLWVPGPSCPKPTGWARAGDFRILVEAGKIQNECAAKVYVEDPACPDVVDYEAEA